MKRWLKLFLIAGLSLLAASSASAQGGFASGISWRYTPAGAFPYGGATVTVCTSAGAGAPCTPKISVFADSGLSIPVTNPLPQCTMSPQTGCIDNLGNFSFYASNGTYTYTITGGNLVPYGPIPISAINGVAGFSLGQHKPSSICVRAEQSHGVGKFHLEQLDFHAEPVELGRNELAGHRKLDGGNKPCEPIVADILRQWKLLERLGKRGGLLLQRKRDRRGNEPKRCLHLDAQRIAGRFQLFLRREPGHSREHQCRRTFRGKQRD